MRILFVEDDLEFRDRLADYLVANGLDVDVFADFDAVRRALRCAPALLLLALNVGGQDGLAFLREALRDGASASVVLSADADEKDPVVALELGADDFITKATRRREILARLRAVLRRAGSGSQFTRWRFLPERRRLLRPDGSNVALTTAEFSLLAALVENQGRALGREELFGVVFGRQFNPLDRAIDNLVAKLRAKLGDPVREPVMIRTIRPVGYTFTGFPTDQRE